MKKFSRENENKSLKLDFPAYFDLKFLRLNKNVDGFIINLMKFRIWIFQFPSSLNNPACQDPLVFAFSGGDGKIVGGLWSIVNGPHQHLISSYISKWNMFSIIFNLLKI